LGLLVTVSPTKKYPSLRNKKKLFVRLLQEKQTSSTSSALTLSKAPLSPIVSSFSHKISKFQPACKEKKSLHARQAEPECKKNSFFKLLALLPLT